MTKHNPDKKIPPKKEQGKGNAPLKPPKQHGGRGKSDNTRLSNE